MSDLCDTLVTVVTPTYNRASQVTNAINSALAQTHRNLEVIVIDDGSTDDTPTVLAKITDARVRLLQQQNQGQSVARNRAIAAAKGKFVAFLDSDDTWLAGKLADQLTIFSKHPDVDVVFGDRRDISANDSVYRSVGLPEGPQNMLRSLLMGNVINFNSSMVRTHALLEYPFDESMRAGEDYDLWLRMAPKVTFFYRAEPWLNYSVGPGRLSERFEPVFENNEKSIQRVFEHCDGEFERSFISRVWCLFYARLARCYARDGKIPVAIRSSLRAIRWSPASLLGWRALLACILRRA